MKDFFELDDFETVYGPSQRLAVEIANEKLNKLIESWPVVYAHKNGEQIWAQAIYVKENVYKARLAFIEEIKKEPCKHEPEALEVRSYGYVTIGTAKCKHCEVELKATWSEKK